MPSKTLKRGSRRQVWNGKAEMTAGGLKKEDLTKNTRGRIVSVKKCQTMKKTYKGSDSEDEEPETKDEPKEPNKTTGGFWNLFD
jgi:hypothetical protein